MPIGYDLPDPFQRLPLTLEGTVAGRSSIRPDMEAAGVSLSNIESRSAWGSNLFEGRADSVDAIGRDAAARRAMRAKDAQFNADADARTRNAALPSPRIDSTTRFYQRMADRFGGGREGDAIVSNINRRRVVLSAPLAQGTGGLSSGIGGRSSGLRTGGLTSGQTVSQIPKEISVKHVGPPEWVKKVNAVNP